MLRPSPEWKVLLEPFQSLFTKPGYRYFCAFVLVFAHIDQRLWVTQVVLSGLVNRHFTNFYRFLKEGAWNTEAVTQQIWRLSGARCAQGDRLFAAIDDTVVTKSGKKFPALGWHHNPMNKDHPKRLSHGHCFVCLAALSEQVKEHFVALFAAAALYVPEKQTCKEEGWLFATKLELAARLLAGVGTLPEVVVFAVVDGAYARHAFVHPVVAAGCHVVSRLRRDTVFYDLPPVKREAQGTERKAPQVRAQAQGQPVGRQADGVEVGDRAPLWQGSEPLSQDTGGHTAHALGADTAGGGALGKSPARVSLLHRHSPFGRTDRARVWCPLCY